MPLQRSEGACKSPSELPPGRDFIFCLLSCFSFTPLLKRNQKMTLRGTAHCNRCVTHKYTETHRELWRIELVLSMKCQLHQIQSIKQK